MRISSSQFEMGLRDGTDSVSPYGDINWNPDAFDLLPGPDHKSLTNEEFGYQETALDAETQNLVCFCAQEHLKISTHLPE